MLMALQNYVAGRCYEYDVAPKRFSFLQLCEPVPPSDVILVLTAVSDVSGHLTSQRDALAVWASQICT